MCLMVSPSVRASDTIDHFALARLRTRKLKTKCVKRQRRT